jgi:hypothetical protein
MKKLKILLIVFLILLSVSVFVNMQTAKAAVPTVPAPTLNPSSPISLGSSVTASVTILGNGSSGTPTGSVTFQYSLNSGSTWTNLGTTVILVGGSATSTSYTPTAPGSNYQFRASYGGNLNYTSLTGGSTILTVNKATATVGAASFAPASPIALGGSVTVSVSVSGPGGVVSPTGNVQFQVKIGASSYANFGSAVALSGGSASISYTPQTATTYNFQAVYQGDGNYNSGTIGLQSGTLTVNKAAPTIAAPTLNPSDSVTVGTSVSISVNVPGGGAVPTGTATFQVNIGGGVWNNIGSVISLSSGSASAIYVPQSAGSYQFQVIYSGDSNYNGANSSAVYLTVTSGLTVGVSPVGPLTMDVGQTQLFTATASGGTGTKTYQWYFDGAVVSEQIASTYSYLSVLGSHTIYVRVTDNVPVTVQSNTVSVAVNSALGVSIAPFSWAMDVGQSKLFTATASGGSGIYSSYQWYVDGSTISGATAQSCCFYYNIPRAILFYVKGNDSLGATSVQSSGAPVKVNAVPTTSPAPTPAPTYSSTTTRTPTPTSKPTSVPAATPPAPTPTLKAIKVRAIMNDGAKVDLAITGNMTISQILNVKIVAYQSSALSSVSFTVVGESGSAGFCNITIPRSVVSNGQSPVVFIDGTKALTQGYVQDADNFYVWFTTAFSMHHVTTQFTLPSISSSASIGPILAVGITVPEIVTIYIVIAIRRLRRTPEKI